MLVMKINPTKAKFKIWNAYANREISVYWSLP